MSHVSDHDKRMNASRLALLTMLALPLAPLEAGELDTLRQRCTEQERQIRELEEENARLRNQLSGDPLPAVPPKETPAPSSTTTATPRATTTATTSAPTSRTHTVKPGETLTKIARQYSVTPEAIIKANRLKDPSVVRVGSKLSIPGTAPASATSPTSPAATGSAETHAVAERETLYGIARSHGTTVQAILDANPGIDPTRLKIGQKLKLPGKTAATGGSTKPSSTKPVTSTPAPVSTTPDEITQAPADKPASPAETPGSAPAAAEPTIRKITIDQEVTFGEFAAKHGTTAEKLNDLNGWTLSNSTTLAKGSELYVPVNP